MNVRSGVGDLHHLPSISHIAFGDEIICIPFLSDIIPLRRIQ
jgi:hypothetical protein